jgi:hypothetical protein
MASSLAACGRDGGNSSPSPNLPPRTCVMGFSALPPRLDPALVTRVVDLWARRGDAGLVLQEPPWTEPLAGADPESLVRANPLGVASYFRGKGLRIFASIDPTNGLDRARDSTALVAAGRSLADPDVRELYRRYVGAFATLVRPEALAVASETNLIRASAPPRLYGSLVAAANLAAAEARQRDPSLRLLITVQVEVARGRLPGGWEPESPRIAPTFRSCRPWASRRIPISSAPPIPTSCPSSTTRSWWRARRCRST